MICCSEAIERCLRRLLNNNKYQELFGDRASTIYLNEVANYTNMIKPIHQMEQILKEKIILQMFDDFFIRALRC